MLRLAQYIFKIALENNIHKKQVNLMKFLSQVTRELGVSKYTYVVGGAVRNFIIDQPIKDLDLVIDSIRAGRDSDWLAQEIAKKLPCESNIATNNYGVAILTVKGPWILDGEDMSGEVLEIANARKESYGGAAGKGYKPDQVETATLDQDAKRREFNLNTLLWDLEGLKDGPTEAHKVSRSEGGQVQDITGRGLKDLKNRSLVNPDHPLKVYTDDPTRLFRLIKFENKYNLKAPESYDEDAINKLKEFKSKLTTNDLKNIKESLKIQDTADETADEKLNKLLDITDPKELIKACAPAIHKSPHSAISKYLISDVLPGSNPVGKLKDLGLWEELLKRVNKERDFAATLKNALNDIDIKVSIALIESGLDKKNTPFSDFDLTEIKKFKENIKNMSEEDTKDYFKSVKKPVLDNEKLMNLGLQGRALGTAGSIAKEIILMNPQLFKETSTLTDMVIQKLGLTAA